MSKFPWDPPLLIVEWVDAEADAEWTELEELMEEDAPKACLTVGWLVKETDKVLILVDSRAKDPTDHTVGSWIKIPTPWVCHKTELKNPGEHLPPGAGPPLIA